MTEIKMREIPTDLYSDEQVTFQFSEYELMLLLALLDVDTEIDNLCLGKLDPEFFWNEFHDDFLSKDQSAVLVAALHRFSLKFPFLVDVGLISEQGFVAGMDGKDISVCKLEDKRMRILWMEAHSLGVKSSPCEDPFINNSQAVLLNVFSDGLIELSMSEYELSILLVSIDYFADVDTSRLFAGGKSNYLFSRKNGDKHSRFNDKESDALVLALRRLLKALPFIFRSYTAKLAAVKSFHDQSLVPRVSEDERWLAFYNHYFKFEACLDSRTDALLEGLSGDLEEVWVKGVKAAANGIPKTGYYERADLKPSWLGGYEWKIANGDFGNLCINQITIINEAFTSFDTHDFIEKGTRIRFENSSEIEDEWFTICEFNTLKDFTFASLLLESNNFLIKHYESKGEQLPELYILGGFMNLEGEIELELDVQMPVNN